MKHDLATALWTIERARSLGAAARAAGREAAVHVKIDTGMTRLGLDLGDLQAFGEALRDVAGLRVAGVFSHLASADAVETASARTQIERFGSGVEALAATGLRPELVHLANSAAVLAAPGAHFTMVRPGIMLYGYPPAPHLAAHAALRPALRLRSALAQVRAVPAGTPVGYGGTFVAARPSRIGVVPVGYADGYHRLASNRASVLVRGQRAPIAGRVCMDHTMVDVTGVGEVGASEPVVLVGGQGAAMIGADEVAGWCETIPYEVLTSVGRRVPRIYVEEFTDA